MNLHLIGYSGHAFVVIDSAMQNDLKILDYFETEEKKLNPYQLKFSGSEELILKNSSYKEQLFFIGIGDNFIRERIFEKLASYQFANIIDKSANVSPTAKLKTGIYIGKNTSVNALTVIGSGAIINTGAIVEHECEIGDFAHVAPGAVLCGNVKIGKNSFIGANSVIKQGIVIGNNVTIGAGSVVVKDLPDNVVAFGNPLTIKK